MRDSTTASVLENAWDTRDWFDQMPTCGERNEPCGSSELPDSGRLLGALESQSSDRSPSQSARRSDHPLLTVSGFDSSSLIVLPR